MFCPKCGAKVKKADFCPSCGAKVGEEKAKTGAAGAALSIAAGPNIGPAAAAILGGVLILISLSLDWMCTPISQFGCISAFAMATAAGTFGVSLMNTVASFLILFGILVLIGGCMHFARIKAANILCNTGGWLTLASSVIGILIISSVPGVSPGIGVWLCVIGGIIAVVAPHIKKE